MYAILSAPRFGVYHEQWLERSPYPPTSGVAGFLQIGLHTNELSTGAGTVCGPHESVALSHRPASGVTSPNCMPDGSGGYAQTPDAAHLFEAAVQGFCALGEE